MELAEKFEKPSTSSCPRWGRKGADGEAVGAVAQQGPRARQGVEELRDKLAGGTPPPLSPPVPTRDSPLRAVVLPLFSFPNLLEVPLLSNSAPDLHGEGVLGSVLLSLMEPARRAAPPSSPASSAPSPCPEPGPEQFTLSHRVSPPPPPRALDLERPCSLL